MVKELNRLVSRFAATPLGQARPPARHRAGLMNLADRLARGPAPAPVAPGTAALVRRHVCRARAAPGHGAAAAPPTDALAKLKDRVGKALFERMGSRMNDPSLCAEPCAPSCWASSTRSSRRRTSRSARRSGSG